MFRQNIWFAMKPPPLWLWALIVFSENTGNDDDDVDNEKDNDDVDDDDDKAIDQESVVGFLSKGFPE